MALIRSINFLMTHTVARQILAMSEDAKNVVYVGKD
jgi:hypothetical protein